MSFASSILPSLDAIRGITGGLGLHKFTVLRRLIHWDGGAPGLGTKTFTDTPLFVNGNQNPKVAQVSGKDIILSGGQYTDQDYKIGPFTPTFPGGGIADATVDPVVVPGDELHFFLNGPGLSPNGAWFKRIGDVSDSSLHVYLIVRATGNTNP